MQAAKRERSARRPHMRRPHMRRPHVRRPHMRRPAVLKPVARRAPPCAPVPRARERARTRQRDIASSATPFVRGPISPIDAITIAIAPAMNTNTPGVPNPFSTAAIANDVKIAEKRLHE